jgi:hypothetical protein
LEFNTLGSDVIPNRGTRNACDGEVKRGDGEEGKGRESQREKKQREREREKMKR